MKLAKVNLETIIPHLLAKDLAQIKLTNGLLRALFRRIITDRTLSITIWNGTSRCAPTTDVRIIWHQSSASLNVWVAPNYRKLRVKAADYRPVLEEKTRKAILGAVLYSRAKAQVGVTCAG